MDFTRIQILIRSSKKIAGSDLKENPGSRYEFNLREEKTDPDSDPTLEKQPGSGSFWPKNFYYNFDLEAFQILIFRPDLDPAKF